MNIAELINQEDSLSRHGLLIERRPDGTLAANVPHVRHHSPAGYECGYAGSGPADLALSVLHALIPPLSEQDEQALYELQGEEFEEAIGNLANWSQKVGPDRVRVNNLAYRLHQVFKSEFIAGMPKEGGYIPIETIRAWIEKQKVQMQAA